MAAYSGVHNMSAWNQIIGSKIGSEARITRSNVTVERSRCCDENKNKAMPMPPRKLMLLAARQG
jgi:hypothetical protein